MFVDTAKIKIKAGDGGDGAVSFHHLPISVIKENMPQKRAKTAEAADAVVKMPKTLLSVFLSELL